MRRPLVELTLMIALLFVVPSAWADTRPVFADDYPSDVAAVWFDTLYELVKSETIDYPEASRIYGVSAVALYEAVVPGALHHRSLVGQLQSLVAVPQPKGSEQHHWPTVANAALAGTIRGVFRSLSPENLKAINALEQRFAAQFHAEVMQQDVLIFLPPGAPADAITKVSALRGARRSGRRRDSRVGRHRRVFAL